MSSPRKPFGLNLLLPFLDEGLLETCLDEGVAALVLFWGDATPHLQVAQRAGVKVVPQVGSVEEAKAAADAGADAVMIQGVEAGGHVRGTAALSGPPARGRGRGLAAAGRAAGGVADGRGVAAALMFGAQAVSMGTRFVCSDEAALARAYKERVIRARAEDTVHTLLFDVGWPDAAHRALRNAAVEAWEAAGSPASGQRPGEGTIVGRYSVAGQVIDVQKYAVDPPMADFEGDIEQTALYCGQSCSLVHDIRPAADIVADLAREATDVLASPALRPRGDRRSAGSAGGPAAVHVRSPGRCRSVDASDARNSSTPSSSPSIAGPAHGRVAGDPAQPLVLGLEHRRGQLGLEVAGGDAVDPHVVAGPLQRQLPGQADHGRAWRSRRRPGCWAQLPTWPCTEPMLIDRPRSAARSSSGPTSDDSTKRR